MSGIPHKVIADPDTRYGDGRAETRQFTIQRITAMASVVFMLFVVWFVVRHAGEDHAELVETIRAPWVWIPLVLLLINVPVHMRIGMREVIEDYVHEPRLNRFALMANTYAALVIGLVGIGSVLTIVIWG
jgi:succinate dehydrogenase / fumarate reductase membrane anchor subunit